MPGGVRERGGGLGKRGAGWTRWSHLIVAGLTPMFSAKFHQGERRDPRARVLLSLTPEAGASVDM